MANCRGATSLEAARVTRLRDTLLELGTGFAFVGQQVHLDIGGDDFYIAAVDDRLRERRR